jgi:glyoxalase family protein
MPSPILGLHHVTATVDDAQADLDFAVGLLGLRLVKQTVNFDNHHVFHFYYGDRVGTPGTIWTTFPYKGHGVRVGRQGAGQFTATSFSVPARSLEFWRDRLATAGVPTTETHPRFGDRVLTCHDPSGLVIELIATSDDPRVPWTTPATGEDRAVRGVHSVTATVRTAGPTLDFITALLGFTVVSTDGDRTRLAIGAGGAGRTIDVVEAPQAPSAANGLGTVHHVALAVESPAAQLEMREAILHRGISVTPVLDRQYFQSIYFREPGGVLFEIATSAPGFAVDEAVDALGTALKLPEWEEAHRREIQQGLPRVTFPTTRP